MLRCVLRGRRHGFARRAGTADVRLFPAKPCAPCRRALRGLRRAPAYFAESTRVLSAEYFPTFRKAPVLLHLKNQATSKH